MKKLVSLMLALFVLCGAVALADTINQDSENRSVSVELSLTLEGGFEVIIPTELNFGDPIPVEDPDEATQDHVYYVADAVIDVARAKMAESILVIYTDSANSFELKDGDTAIVYHLEITPDGAGYLGDNNEMIVNKNQVSNFNLRFWTDSAPVDGFPAGTFTDTLTFRVELEG